MSLALRTAIEVPWSDFPRFRKVQAMRGAFRRWLNKAGIGQQFVMHLAADGKSAYVLRVAAGGGVAPGQVDAEDSDLTCLAAQNRGLSDEAVVFLATCAVSLARRLEHG
jgi:hypothetical protein